MKRRRKGIRTKTIIFSCTLTRTNTINSTFTRILNCSSQKSYTDISFMGIMLSLQNTFVLLRFILSKYVLHMCVCVSVFAYPKVKTRKKKRENKFWILWNAISIRIELGTSNAQWCATQIYHTRTYIKFVHLWYTVCFIVDSPMAFVTIPHIWFA